MTVDGKVVVVTGGASGVGQALCQRFASEGARAVVVSDIDGDGAREIAAKIGGLAVVTDVGVEREVQQLVQQATESYGQIDVFCCNAGISLEGGVEVPDSEWQRIWQVNFMAHVYAVRALLPGMLQRGEGAFLMTASAAGLLTQIGSDPYTVTKHADVALAEWLTVTYGDQGIKVFCLCPQGVKTPMLLEFEAESAIGDYLVEIAIEPDEVAAAVLVGMAKERFLILPHAEVAAYMQRKAEDPDRWLGGMRKFKRSLDNGD